MSESETKSEFGINSAMEDEGKLFVAFDKAPEFLEKLTVFLNVDLQCEPTPSQAHTENVLFHSLTMIVREEGSCFQPWPAEFMRPAGRIPRASLSARSVFRPNGESDRECIQSTCCTICF